MQSQIFRVVFEDSAILVIEKLHPFLSQRGDYGKAEGLDEFLSRIRKEKIFAVHRLDREVLGLMIFAKSAAVADRLSEQFRERQVRKVYEALVSGRVYKDSDTLVHYLKKNPKNNHVTVYSRPTDDAKKAELSYFVLERGQGVTRLLISLKTGRTHQIRVQLSKIGHPIVGDARYGKKTDEIEQTSIGLRSVYLGVKHPLTGELQQWTLLSHSDLRALETKEFL